MYFLFLITFVSFIINSGHFAAAAGLNKDGLPYNMYILCLNGSSKNKEYVQKHLYNMAHNYELFPGVC